MWITGGKLYISVGKVVYIVLLGVASLGLEVIGWELRVGSWEVEFEIWSVEIFAHGRCYHHSIP